MLSLIETLAATFLFLAVFTVFLFDYSTSVRYVVQKCESYATGLYYSAKLQQIVYGAVPSLDNVSEIGPLLASAGLANYSISDISLNSSGSNAQRGACNTLNRVVDLSDRLYLISVCT